MMSAELPAARVPAADTARARSYPDEAGGILIQRHHERVAQGRVVVRVMAIVAEPARETVEQRQAVGRTDPEAAGLILEQRPHVVAAERCRVARVVAKRLEDTAVAIHADEAGLVRAYPQRAALVLEDSRDRLVMQRVRLAGRRAGARHRARCGMPLIEPAVRADPDIAGAVEGECRNAVAGERAGVVGGVTQVLDVSRGRVEHIDAGIVRPDPDQAA